MPSFFDIQFVLYFSRRMSLLKKSTTKILLEKVNHVLVCRGTDVSSQISCPNRQSANLDCFQVRTTTDGMKFGRATKPVPMSIAWIGQSTGSAANVSSESKLTLKCSNFVRSANSNWRPFILETLNSNWRPFILAPNSSNFQGNDLHLKVEIGFSTTNWCGVSCLIGKFKCPSSVRNMGWGQP